MRGSVELSPRLLITSQLIKGGGTLADIGTDHAYLPCYLLQHGIIDRAIACDIAAGPLANAESTVNRFSLSDKVDLLLSDGLSAVSPNDAQEIVIAGMGGTLIVDILSRAEWVVEGERHFVFQPQSRAEELREYLCKNGFEIGKELAAFEGEHVYIAFDARYVGSIAAEDEAFYWIGKLPDCENSAAKAYMNKQRDRLGRMRMGAELSGNALRVNDIDAIINAIDEVLNG